MSSAVAAPPRCRCVPAPPPSAGHANGPEKGIASPVLPAWSVTPASAAAPPGTADGEGPDAALPRPPLPTPPAHEMRAAASCNAGRPGQPGAGQDVLDQSPPAR